MTMTKMRFAVLPLIVVLVMIAGQSNVVKIAALTTFWIKSVASPVDRYPKVIHLQTNRQYRVLGFVIEIRLPPIVNLLASVTPIV